MTRRNATLLTAALLAALPLIWAAARSDDPSSSQPPVAAPAAARARPVPGLPADVARLLGEGRNWRAARRLREVVGPASDPELVLVAARAEAGWGGWARTRALLEGRPWLDRAGGGEGWFLLGRALEEADRPVEAADAYARYLRTPAASRGGAVAELRLARLLLREGRTAKGTAALDRLRGMAPAAAGWAALLAAEARAPRGDTVGVRALLDPALDPPAGRAAAALLEAYRVAGAPAGAVAPALRFAAAERSPAERAAALSAAGQGAALAGNRPAAQAHFRAALAAAPASRGAGTAAEGLERIGSLTPADRRALGDTWIRRGDTGRGAAHLVAWLASGAGSAAEREAVRLRAGRAWFAARRYASAVETLAPLTRGAGDAAAEALFWTGRAQLRGGPGSSRASFTTLAERFPASPWAGDGVFLLADVDQDAGRREAARAGYRQVVERHPTSPSAGQAAARLGSAAILGGNPRAAAALWDGLRARAAGDDARAQAAYWAGRAYAAAGDAAGARARWREARRLAPVSYYAVLAARRLDEAYWPPALSAAPPVDSAAAARAAAALQAADLLQAAGLFADAEAEVDRVAAAAGEERTARYALAEALSARGWTVHALRLGRAMEAAGEPPNVRLLRILYPFHHRAMMSAEARERGLDPFLVAALTRQESVFRDRAHSLAGARGLMQVMPQTGRGLAAGEGLTGWDAEMLFNPEINVHLGTRYLAAQMRAYDENLPYVFSAYNAGPGRVRRWRNFPEARDPEMFTERIPFEETREYVKILTRNIALYRGLYGG